MPRSRRSSAVRLALRAGGYSTIGVALTLPFVRRRLRVPAALTTAACVAAPLATAVLYPRSKKRDVALFALQMWAFAVVHELPYDDPEALRRRLRARYPVVSDRLIGAGRLPGVRLQEALAGLPRVGAVNRLLAYAHWAWFTEPYLALAWILAHDESRFPRAGRQMASVFDIGCAVYIALPTAPPWWASQEGVTGSEKVRRVMVEVGEETWGPAWPRMFGTLNGNPWAAMPSLHFATSVQAAISLAETGRTEGALGWGYAATLGFGLVYLGEHYVTDLIAGALLVAAVRRGEVLVEPLVAEFNKTLRRLEGLANG